MQSVPPTGSFMKPSTLPTFLRRDIGDSKWWAGVSVLEANPAESECWVAEHYTGFKYILSRGTKKGEYVKNTYHKNIHEPGSDYVLVSQHPFTTVVAEAEAEEVNENPQDTEKSTRLADADAARDAYLSLFTNVNAGN